MGSRKPSLSFLSCFTRQRKESKSSYDIVEPKVEPFNLIKFCQREQSDAPMFIKLYLTKTASESDRANTIQFAHPHDIYELFRNGETVPSLDSYAYADVVFDLFLDNLLEPLIPHSLQKLLPNLDGSNSIDINTGALKAVLEKLPKINYNTVKLISTYYNENESLKGILHASTKFGCALLGHKNNGWYEKFDDAQELGAFFFRFHNELFN